MFQLTDDALSQMISLVEDEHHVVDVNKSFNIENEINNYRNQLKNQNVLDVNNKEYDYQMGVHYMDIIGECEKLGDYVVNVVEASSNVKEKKSWPERAMVNRIGAEVQGLTYDGLNTLYLCVF